MRVALLQIALEPKSRASNLQRISRAVETAAGADPAPDLLVLPGRCDTGGAVGSRGLYDASLTAVRERLAGLAREWGVFIAAGLHCRHGDAFEPRAVLIDADGDVAVQVGDERGGAVTVGRHSVRWWPTAIGRLGVFQMSEADGALPDADSESGPAFIAFPVSRTAAGKVGRSTASGLAKLRDDATAGAGISWVVVSPAETDGDTEDAHAPLSFVRGPDGSIVAASKTSHEAIVHADIVVASTE